jgi:SSS family solute:Na+ symporter
VWLDPALPDHRMIPLAIQLGPIDVTIFVAYFIAIVGLGLWVARREKRTTRDYFLAGDRLPWYAIGASVLASNISAEHFVGMIGWAYTYGMVIANFEWGAWLTWSLALWFFLPFYLRSRISTMPEFLEQRYGRTCRYLLSVTSIITYVTALEGAVLFAGAKALLVFFDIPLHWGVLLLAGATAIYTIGGGLLSVVWTDAAQCLVFLVGGATVTILGLKKVGGLGALMHELPEKFHMYHLSHPQCPIAAYYICSFFVGAYYISSNQFMIQRCLGARSDWDGRMGLLFSNYLKILMPFIVVLPGVIAFKLFPGLSDPDQAYPRLVGAVLSPGFVGLIMAALAAAIMSTLSSAANSASTLLTLDLIRPLMRQPVAELTLVRIGKLSTAAVLLVGTLLGVFYSKLQDDSGQPVAVFSLIMNIFFFIGPPLSIVFLAGIFWRRATSAAAVSTIIGGYLAALLSQYLILTPMHQLPSTLLSLVDAFGFSDAKRAIDHSWLVIHFNNFLYVAIWNGIICLAIMVAVSLITTPAPAERIDHLIWKPSVVRIDPGSSRSRTGRSILFWWIVCMALTGALYGYFAWFQFAPDRM